MATAIDPLVSPAANLGDWRRAARIALVLIASGSYGPAYGASWRVVPEVGLTETYSDNATQVSGPDARNGWITTVAPGLRVTGAGPRVVAFVDFRHDESYYHGQSSSNASRNFLSSFVTVEAVDNWMYVDASAAITPRSSSVFSLNNANTNNAATNQEETRVLQVSPYVRGRAFGSTDYLMRFNTIDARSTDNTLAHTTVEQLTGALRHSGGQGAIGWFADANGVRVDSDAFGQRRDDRVQAGLNFPLTSRLHVLALTGRERTNFVSGTDESLATPGVGFEWRPSERTRATGIRQKRFFGYGHDLAVTHQTGRTAWRYSDVKDVSVLPMGLAGFSRGSIYELMADLMTTSVPDPVARDAAARAQTDQIGPVGGVFDATGVLASRIFLDRTQQASVALLGIRGIVTLMLQQRDQELLEGSQPTIIDDFTLSPEIRDRSTLLSWAHQLTPVTTLNISALYLKRQGLSVPDLEATQRSGTAMVSFRLSPKANASVAVRVTNFSNFVAAGPIHERALVGSLVQRF
jgi:uncharacterized protein (PEP-CTERM system associated)